MNECVHECMECVHTWIIPNHTDLAASYTEGTRRVLQAYIYGAGRVTFGMEVKKRKRMEKEGKESIVRRRRGGKKKERWRGWEEE